MSLARAFHKRCMSTTPWFVDAPPHMQSNASSLRRAVPFPPIPSDAPLALKTLHSRLQDSPFLEPSMLLITRPVLSPTDPALLPVQRESSGTRRRRGGTIAGESTFDVPGGLWSWMMFAQVKDGTESKGTVESVVRQIRKFVSTIPHTMYPNN